MEYKNKRLGGVVTLIVGGVLGKIFIRDVLEAANDGQAEITIYRTGIVASIICVLLGFFYIIFGDKAERIMQIDENNLKFKDIIILLTLGGVGLAAYAWVNMELSGLGYK